MLLFSTVVEINFPDLRLSKVQKYSRVFDKITKKKKKVQNKTTTTHNNNNNNNVNFDRHVCDCNGRKPHKRPRSIIDYFSHVKGTYTIKYYNIQRTEKTNKQRK